MPPTPSDSFRVTSSGARVLVMAPENGQCCPVTEKAGWATVGTEIVHDTFGTGTVVEVGDYKGMPTVWVNFDPGSVKALALEYATSCVRPRRRWDRRTPASPDERCDVCGARPVVLQIDSHRYCDAHRSSYDPTR